MQTIGDKAFYYCTGLNNVVIGNSVTEIGKQAFSDCSSLSSITSLNTTPPNIDSSTFDETTENNATLHVPEGCKSVYWLYPYWENFKNIQADAGVGIENVAIESDEPCIEDNNIYTIEGIKINNNDVSNLQKGLYIINGKKILIK